MTKLFLVPFLLCLSACAPISMTTSSNTALGEIDYDYLEKNIVLEKTTNIDILKYFGKPNIIFQYSDLRRSFQYYFHKTINKYGYSNFKSALRQIFIGNGEDTGMEIKNFVVVFTPDNKVESFTLSTDNIDYQNQDNNDIQTAKLKYTNHYYSGILDREKIFALLIPGKTTKHQVMRLPDLGQPDMVTGNTWTYSFAPTQNKVAQSEIAAQVPIAMMAGAAIFSRPTPLILEFDENDVLISRTFIDPGELTEEEKSVLAGSPIPSSTITETEQP